MNGSRRFRRARGVWVPHEAGVRLANIPELSSGLMLDLDARFGVTLAGSDVSAWADGAGAANNFSEATNRPAYSASDANWGGRPSIAYASAGADKLSSVDLASTWKFLHDGTGGTLAFIVRPTVATVSRLGTTSDGASQVGMFAAWDGVNNRFSFGTSNGVSTSTLGADIGSAAVNTRYSVVVTYKSSIDKSIYQNGSLMVSAAYASPSAADPTNTLRLGRPWGFTADFDGTINAVHAWTRYFTAADAALYHRWAVANWLA